MRVFLLSVCLLAAVGCQGDREFRLFGYSTEPLHDPGIRTVYVPVFKNKALQTSPNREMEIELTKAVVREIESRTRMKVVTDPERADSELNGELISMVRLTVNPNQQLLAREAEVKLTAEVVWRDLRTGKVLSNGGRPRQDPPAVPFDPTLPPPDPVAVKPEKPYPARVVATGRILPELGETNATGNRMAVNTLAKRVVDLMEQPW